MITLRVKVRRGKLRKEDGNDVIVICNGTKTLLKVFVSPEFNGEIPERADIVTVNRKMHLIPEEKKDERLFIIDTIEVLSFRLDLHSVELDEKLTTACVKEKKEDGNPYKTILAYAAILDFGEKIVSREYSHYRRVVSYSKENGLEVFNIDCRDKAKFPH